MLKARGGVIPRGAGGERERESGRGRETERDRDRDSDREKEKERERARRTTLTLQHCNTLLQWAVVDTAGRSAITPEYLAA